MAEAQLYYIGTSKSKEIRKRGSVTGYDWGGKGAWTTFKTPTPASKKKVKYDKKAKAKKGSVKLGGLGHGTKVHGSYIPATASRIIGGVEKPDCRVRYWVRGYTKYANTSALKKKKQMYKIVYNTTHPYQYRLQYEDKPVIDVTYSGYEDGVDYIYFADHYWKDGEQIATTGHLPHPTTFDVTFSDVRRNLESTAYVSDGRDNRGSYILTNVRANVVTLNVTWQGLSEDEGADLLDTLNPTIDDTGKYNYLTVQFLHPAKNEVVNKTFYASDRSVSRYPNGVFKSISVTLTEV